MQNTDIRIHLVAEAVASTPTGYYATFHTPSAVIPFSIDDIGYDDFACPVLSEDIVIVKKRSTESGVTNMVASYLSGENFYSDVTFLAFDQKTRTLTLPTLDQLKLIMDMLCIRIDTGEQGNVSFTEDEEPYTPDIDPSLVSDAPLDLFKDLAI